MTRFIPPHVIPPHAIPRRDDMLAGLPVLLAIATLPFLATLAEALL